MKKKLVLLLFVQWVLFVSQAFSQNAEEEKRAAFEQARKDYRTYLNELKALHAQYKEITGEIQKVLREEGLPSWEEGGSDQGTFGDVDIQETAKTMVVKADLPGLEKDALKVSVENGRTLKIKGARELEKVETKEAGGAKVYKSERQHGGFLRQIELPADAEDTGLQASYENGVLTVTIPKRESAGKEVEVPVH
jgi:HSP20 family protein